MAGESTLFGLSTLTEVLRDGGARVRDGGRGVRKKLLLGQGDEQVLEFSEPPLTQCCRPSGQERRREVSCDLGLAGSGVEHDFCKTVNA